MIHSFAGSAQIAEQIQQKGGYLSFSAWALVEKKLQKTAEILKAVNPERILIETDSPFGIGLNKYHPFLEKNSDGRNRNVPANLPAIAVGLAELMGMDKGEFAELTTKNAMRFLQQII